MHMYIFFSSFVCLCSLSSCSYMTWPEILEDLHLIEVIESEVEDAVGKGKE